VTARAHNEACRLICLAATIAVSMFSPSNVAAQATQLPAVPPGPQQTAEALTLEAAFARALTSNPAIAAARLRRAINAAGIDVARERLNPEAHAEVEKETPKQSFGLAVPLELGGKRSRRIAVAQAALETGEAELAAVILDIRMQVRRA
jgi:cobalt-zinc-cadmium efflux system outer membrane protein